MHKEKLIDLKKKIDRKRKVMFKYAKDHGLTDNRTIKISQELDDLIFSFLLLHQKQKEQAQ